MSDKKSEKSKSANKPNPIVLSINVCDTIIRDEKTQKVSLIGLFNAIHAKTFPARHPLMHAYIALTNGHGKHKIKIQFIRDEDNEIIVSMDGEMEFPNPLAIIELNLEWRGMQFDKPGNHNVQVLSDEEIIGSRKFIVNHIKQKMPPTEGTGRM